MLKTSWKVLGFLSFPLLFIFSFRVFRAYIFRSPSFTRKASFPQWHDTHLNFSLNRGNSVPPLSPLFFLPPFPSPPPPRFFHSPLPLFLVIPDPSGLSVAKSSFSPLPSSTSRQSNLIKVHPCSVSVLSVSHQPRLFFYLRTSLRRSPLPPPPPPGLVVTPEIWIILSISLVKCRPMKFDVDRGQYGLC